MKLVSKCYERCFFVVVRVFFFLLSDFPFRKTLSFFNRSFLNIILINDNILRQVTVAEF